MKGCYLSLWCWILSLISCTANELGHVYKVGESVTLWLNRVGPLNNPQETYAFYSLPFCGLSGSDTKSKRGSGIGNILEWTELILAPMNFQFRVDTPKSVICRQKLNVNDAGKFCDAIAQQYWYQMYFDDLPIWAMVGELRTPENAKSMSESKAFIYTAREFSIAFNQDHIIELNMTHAEPVEVAPDKEIEFTYSVTWIPTSRSYNKRFERYLDYSFFEHQIHWFSIFNSFMMVLFLIGLVVMILFRTIKTDYAKYRMEDVEEDKDFGDDSGWKQLSADVFRIPSHFGLFAACYGTGCQLVVFSLLVIVMVIGGSLYTDRRSLASALLASYALTSIVGGYMSGSLYAQYYYPKPPKKWARNVFGSALLLPVITFAMITWLNIVSSLNHSMEVIPVWTVIKMILLWMLLSLPLHITGAVLGRKWNRQPRFPCKVNVLPRQIPEHRWYTHPRTLIFLTGFVPFGSIFIEMYFIFTSFWNYKFYYVYGFMFLALCILVIVCICVTIVCVYFLLNAEDYRWMWISFLASGSTGGYVFLYSVYYFFFKTHMTGFLQTTYYFSYMIVFCLALGLMCGSLGAFGSRIFVHRIYRNTKIE